MLKFSTSSANGRTSNSFSRAMSRARLIWPRVMPKRPAKRGCVGDFRTWDDQIVTGLADAYMDSVPLVAFTGQVSTDLIGNDAFQEADNVGISRPCTKHNVLVKDVERSRAERSRKLFTLPRAAGRVRFSFDIPKDVSMAIDRIQVSG